MATQLANKFRVSSNCSKWVKLLLLEKNSMLMLVGQTLPKQQCFSLLKCNSLSTFTHTHSNACDLGMLHNTVVRVLTYNMRGPGLILGSGIIFIFF